MEKVVAISGLPGSGSTTFARLLAEKLNFHYFSAGQLFKDISSGNYKNKFYSQLFSEICEEKGIIIPNFSSENNSHGTVNLWNSDFGKSKVFHECIDLLQILLAKQGNIVIDGKLALFMVKDASPKIWIKANHEARAKRLSNRDLISIDEAKKILEKRQNFEREEWKKIYGLDYFQQENLADLVIDSSEKSPQQILEEIISDDGMKE